MISRAFDTPCDPSATDSAVPHLFESSACRGLLDFSKVFPFALVATKLWISQQQPLQERPMDAISGMVSAKRAFEAVVAKEHRNDLTVCSVT